MDKTKHDLPCAQYLRVQNGLQGGKAEKSAEVAALVLALVLEEGGNVPSGSDR